MIKRESLEQKDARLEKKFIITDIDFSEVESIVKLHPFVFSEIFSERQVNNIYLDSVNLGNYHDNLEGNLSRFKIRIRWYGETNDLVKKPVLEIKIKEHEFGWKMRFPLKAFILKSGLSQKFLHGRTS